MILSYAHCGRNILGPCNNWEQRVIGGEVRAKVDFGSPGDHFTEVCRMLGDIGTASQQTLKTAIGCRGIGLHSGDRVAMTLHPAAPDTGIVFRRTGSAAEIRANWANTIESPLSTVLSNGEGNTVGTVEHLMAALAGAAIDNAIIELDGREVPIMDGSSAPFLFLIECAGVVEQDAARRAIKILKEVSVSEDGASAALLPDHGFSMSFEIDVDHPVIRRQAACL